MGPPGLPGKRGQRVGHCMFGLGVLAVLRAGRGLQCAALLCAALLCAALPCLQGIMCPLLPLAPLVKCVCVFLLISHEMPGV